MAHQAQVSLATPHQIVTTRILEAPRELVWRVLTTPGLVEPWWGPVGFTTTTHEMDVREGGRWRHTMHGPDGTDYPNRIRYTRVVPPQRLEWMHDDDDSGGGGAELMFSVRLTLDPLGAERTLLTLRHTFRDGAARDANIERYGSVQGAIECVDRLAAQLIATPGECDFLIRREFEASCERVWRAWTDAKQLARWWGPKAFTNTASEADVRVGGSWRVTMSGPVPGPGITHYPVTGAFLEVVPHEKLVMTMDCSGHPAWWHDGVRPGRAPDDVNPAGTMVMTVVFESLAPARTRLTVRQRMVSPEVLAALTGFGMEQGWAESLERLDAAVRPARTPGAVPVRPR